MDDHHPHWPDAQNDHHPRLMTLALDLQVARQLGLRYLTSNTDHRTAVTAYKRLHGIRVAEYQTLNL